MTTELEKITEAIIEVKAREKMRLAGEHGFVPAEVDKGEAAVAIRDILSALDEDERKKIGQMEKSDLTILLSVPFPSDPECYELFRAVFAEKKTLCYQLASTKDCFEPLLSEIRAIILRETLRESFPRRFRFSHDDLLFFGDFIHLCQKYTRRA